MAVYAFIKRTIHPIQVILEFKIQRMKRLLPLNVFFTLLSSFYCSAGFCQGANRVDIGKSFANMTKLSTGGTFNPGDTIEIRVTIAVLRQGTTTTIDSVQVFDAVPAKTTYIPGSMRVATNQGLTYKGPFTELPDTDPGTNIGGNITINLGNGANGVKGGRIRSDTSRPSFYNSACIMMACYKVKINATANYGDTIFVGGSVRYKMIVPATGWTITNFPTYKILLFTNSGYCSNGSNVSAASDSLGTFASGSTQNRAAPLAFSTTYIKQNVSTGQPQDYNYAIVNNSSADGTTIPTSPMPESPSLHRVFGLWDICGDHTGATNPSLGNPPATPGTRRGYFVMVNASYNTNVAYQETLSNLCPNTYYEFSAWFRNLCPRCSCDSAGRGSSSIGFIPYPGNDSSGVRPNLSFEIDGLAYFTTGDIKYDRVGPWKQYGFTFLTKAGQTNANFVIRNNSPGGGGNDWAIDDIKVAHCGPSLTMNYNPYVLGCSSSPFQVDLKDTIRYVYNNSYVYWKWQKSNVGGTVWADMVGAGTSGIGTPVLVNGLYQYVATLPPFFATYADSGTYYRVIVATTAGNLSSAACSYNDGSATMVKVIDCGIILPAQVTQFRGTITNKKAYLSWVTNEESALTRYDVERSFDGRYFERLGSVPARNMTNAFYSFNDPDDLAGNTFYRLKLVGDNNQYKYSNSIVLNTAPKFEIKSIQNPFVDKLNTEAMVPFEGELITVLYNEKGQKINSSKHYVTKGLNKLIVEGFGMMSPGMYIVSYEFNKEFIRKKIIKK